MPLRPCPNTVNCPGSDEPISNFSSEAQDPLDYLGLGYFGTPPPLLRNWTAIECQRFFDSTLSQEDADLQAFAAAQTCSTQVTNPGFTLFTNAPQTCVAICPDGLPFTYTLPGGLFSGISQQAANAIAFAVACRQAQIRKICLGPLFPYCCSGIPYFQTITATGASLNASDLPNVWAVAAGSLPPGLSIVGTPTGPTISLAGIPSTAGTFTFTLSITTPAGDFQEKTFALNVVNIVTPGALPQAQSGQPFSVQFTANVSSTIALAWSVVSGSLPPGLTLNPTTGILSGVPLAGGNYNFVIGFTPA